MLERLKIQDVIITLQELNSGSRLVFIILQLLQAELDRLNEEVLENEK